MSKIVAGAAALAVTALLTLPGPAGAAEQRADGLRNHDTAASTELSSQRYWRRGYVARRTWGPRFAYRPYYQPYYGGYPFYQPWRPYSHGGLPYGYSYGSSPYYYSRPVASFGFGFGPGWGWGWGW